MPGWRAGERKITFRDMPARLQDVGPHVSEQVKRERAAWLEKHDLALVDFLSWKRSPLSRPPSRRKLLPREALRELDEQLEREEIQW